MQTTPQPRAGGGRRLLRSAGWSAAAVAWAGALAAFALRSEPVHLAGSARVSHIVGFGVLTFLVCTAAWAPGSVLRPALVAMVGVLGVLFAFGVGIEVAQAAMGEGRQASRRDVASNAIGILTGFSAWALWWISTPARL